MVSNIRQAPGWGRGRGRGHGAGRRRARRPGGRGPRRDGCPSLAAPPTTAAARTAATSLRQGLTLVDVSAQPRPFLPSTDRCQPLYPTESAYVELTTWRRVSPWLAAGGRAGDADAVFRFLAEEAGLGEDGAARVMSGSQDGDPAGVRGVGLGAETDIAPTDGQDGGGEHTAGGWAAAANPEDAVFLFLAEEAGLGKDGAAKVITEFPDLLLLGGSVESTFAPTVRYLSEEMGLGMDGAVKAVMTSPQLLGCSVERTLEPAMRYLEELEMGEGRALCWVTKYPNLLGLSVEATLAPSISYLEEEVGLPRWGGAN